MGSEHGMMFSQMVGNYTRDNPTSFTGKIAWDLIGNISWEETINVMDTFSRTGINQSSVKSC
jgi:hypothetical protein